MFISKAQINRDYENSSIPSSKAVRRKKITNNREKTGRRPGGQPGHYVATVARTYRKAIDDYMESPEKYQANMPWYQEQISNCTYRQFTTGFFYGKPDENTQIYDNNTYQKEYTYLGFAEAVDERGYAQITQRNKFSVGETIEIMKPDGQNVAVTVKGIYDEEGNSMESAPHAQQKLFIDLGTEIQVYDLLRRAE